MTIKKMKEEEEVLIEQEVDTSADTLKLFVNKLQERIKELDAIQPESILIKDDSLGLTLEFSSHKKTIDELNSIALGSFNYLKSQRKKEIPSWVG
jgi:hypothetical protein